LKNIGSKSSAKAGLDFEDFILKTKEDMMNLKIDEDEEVFFVFKPEDETASQDSGVHDEKDKTLINLR